MRLIFNLCLRRRNKYTWQDPETIEAMQIPTKWFYWHFVLSAFDDLDRLFEVVLVCFEVDLEI